MKTKFTTRTLVAALIAAAGVTSGLAQAEDNGFTITPSVGFMDFDGDRQVDEDVFGSIGLGYKFSNPWQLELVYAEGESELETNGRDVDYKMLHLDALYHLDASGSVQPYLAIGAGAVDFDGTPGRGEETELNAGMGLKIALSEIFSLRTDLRAFHDLDHDNLDFAASLGLQAMFGGSSEKSPAVAAVGDADGDGVSDDRDRCPDTPRGVEVNASGCPLDSDGDGVPNHRDDCPDTEKGARVDAKGCYVILKEAREIELKVNFASNSDIVPTDYYAEVSRLADFLREYPTTKVVIEGHTDSSGKASYNQDLSERRAANVAKVLVGNYEVDAARVSSVGYGEEKPIADNNTAAGKAANRRVVAVVSTVVEKRAQ